MSSFDAGLGTFNANSQGMTDAAGALGAAGKAMDAEVNDLESEVEAQFLGNWEGAARDAYWVNKRAWDAAFARMAELTGMAGVTVESSQEALFGAENANVRSWQLG